MPTPDELQQLSDEIRRAGAMLVQVAHDGDPEILMIVHRCIHRFSRSTNVIGFFLAGSVRGFFVTHMGSSRGNTIASLITLLSVSALSLVATHLPSSCTYAVG